MHIIDVDNERTIDTAIICLTMAELKELRDSLESLIEAPSNNHAHVANESYQKEISICVYGEGIDTSNYDDKLRKILKEEIG